MLAEKTRTIVVKLGGSLITNKDSPMSPDLKAIRAVSKSIRRGLGSKSIAETRLFLVHGGGSFGHYYARKYRLSSKKFVSGNPIGVSKTSTAMQQLHVIILKELVNCGINCMSADTSSLLDTKGNVLSNMGKQTILNYFNNGLVPVSFGNVMITSRGALIVSGDTLCLAFVKNFNVDRVIFAMDVDGIYRNPELKGDIFQSLKPSTSIISEQRKFDVTGGVQSKIKSAFEIAKYGADVFFLNGSKGTRLARCIDGDSTIVATRIKANIPLG